MLKEIEQRQSIRKYLNKPVEPEKILELLKAAMNAPMYMYTRMEFKVITNSQALNDMINYTIYNNDERSSLCYSRNDLNKAISLNMVLINCSAAIENLLIRSSQSRA